MNTINYCQTANINAIIYVNLQRQNPPHHRGHGQFRQRGAAPFPGFRHQGDKDLLARREEAGRHAARAAEPEGEVLHRQRAQQGLGRRRDARRGLRVLRGGAEAGALVRVLPPGGDAHQRPGHGERAGVRHRARGEERGGALDRQGGVPHQRDGHLEGPDGEGGDSEGARARRERGHDHLLHALRQRDGEPRLRHPAVGGADDRGQAHHDNRPQHDALHDDAR